MAKVSHFRYALRFLITICFISAACMVAAQTLGGKAAYNFLSFSPAAPVTAAGGINISHHWNNVAAAYFNPAFLQADLHGKAAMNFTQLAGGVKALHLSGAYHASKQNTSFGGHIFLVQYGSIPETDAAGNEYGTFNAYDYVVQISAAKQYLERWQYGSSLKCIQSFYGSYSSAALAADVGLLYQDSVNGFRAGLVAKNLGFQIKKFSEVGEDLPLDLQIGITKRLLQAPLAFSLTAHHLHRFDMEYNDTTFNNQNNFTASSSFAKKVFNHLVLAGHVYLGQHLEASLGYNFLRRSELSVGSGGNGLTGFSAGLSAKFQKLEIHFSRATYTKGQGYNQIGLQMNLMDLTGTGKL